MSCEDDVIFMIEDCIAIAESYGRSEDEAMECESGELSCPGCPIL